jgi:hypothetical protein
MVVNPSQPALTEGRLSIDSLWSAPSGDPADWAGPTRIAAAADRYFVLDRQSYKIHFVTDSGTWLRSFGKRGPGPGELQSPSDIGIVGANVVVRDLGKLAVHLFTLDGEFVRTIPLGRVGFGFVALPSDGFLVAQLAGSSQSWTRVSLDGTSSPAALPAAAANSTDTSPCLRTAAAGTEIVQLDCAVPLLTFSDSGGRVTRRVRIARDSTLATEDQLRAMRERLERDMARAPVPAGEAKGLLDGLLADARVVGLLRGVRQDSTTGVVAVWEQIPTDLGGGDAVLHFLSKDGVYLARHTFSHAWVDFTMLGSRVVALATDPSTGLVRTIAYRVTWPSGVLDEAARLADERAGAAR